MICIIGPTGSGKSALGMALAKELEGEIIAADSRTIYKGMDIGTAKPNVDDRTTIFHHLIDIINPNEEFSAAEFKKNALKAIKDINSRKHIPIIVGGTGLYVNGLIYDYKFPAGGRNDTRIMLENTDLDVLVERLRILDPVAYNRIDLKNSRRVIRALETIGISSQSNERLNPNILLIGLRPNIEQLNKQIVQRTNEMLRLGLVKEVRELIIKWGRNPRAFNSPGYAEIIKFIDNSISLSETINLINLHTLQLAKRQLTWFKRNEDILWFDSPTDAFEYALSLFNK
jgi:tRNA dimethylallyltransferase